MIAGSLSRSAAVLRRGAAAGRRGLSHMGVHKNKYFEEYNGLREITYKSFRLDTETLPQLAVMLFGFGWLCYHLMKKEAEDRDQRLGIKREYGAAPKVADA